MDKRQSSETRRRQIVDAALAIIDEQGVHRLTSMEIAHRVGIADPTVFRHFANKEAIVTAAIDHFEELLFENFPPDDADPLERLHKFFKMRLGLLAEKPAILHLAFSDRLAEAAGQEGADRMRMLVMRQFGFVRMCLQEAQAQGVIAKEVAPEIMVWSIMGVMRGVTMATQNGLLPPHLINVDTVWQNILRLLKGPTAQA